jgi:peptide/nickel transport system permease protein
MRALPEDAEPEPRPPAELSLEIVARSPWAIFWRRFRSDRVALMGAAFIVVLILLAVFAPLIARDVVRHGPNQLFERTLSDIGLPDGPNVRFWFGADTVGRDVFVRTIYGARTSLLVAVVTTGIAVLVGGVLGLLAGFLGGWVDTVISRSIDIVMSLPVLLLALGVAAVCSTSSQGCLGGLVKPGMPLVIFVISFVNWTLIARIVRGQTITMRNREFIEASRSMGATDRRIMFSELLPNIAAPVIVYATLMIPSNILWEAALSFLGVGIPQTTPSWGRMIADAANGELYTVAWWMMVFPGAFLVLTTLAFNLVGDGLRDAIDPTMGG